MITSGEGKYKVFLEQHMVGDDRVYILGGGVKTHIGGLVVCESGKKPQIIRLENHYDHIVLEPIARVACEKYKTKIVAIGGVHIDNATKQEIDFLVKNCKDLLKKI